MGDGSAALLGQARSKLLLALPPRGASLPFELRARLDLWESGSFLSLLERIEEQRARAGSTSGLRRQRGARASSRPRRGFQEGGASAGSALGLLDA